MSDNNPHTAAPLRLPLKFMHRPAQAGVKEPWLLLLMHGVGSHEEDLFGLAPYVPANFHVISLRAPNVMHADAYAWFNFAVHANGERSIDEEQERESRFLVGEILQSACQQLGVPAERTVAGGFSQGGIMSLSVLLTRPQLMRAAMVCHRRLLPQVLSHVAPREAFEGKSLWVSHGLNDNVIPIGAAVATREFVRQFPLRLAGADFPGAHEIRPAELQQTMAWLQELSGTAPV